VAHVAKRRTQLSAAPGGAGGVSGFDYPRRLNSRDTPETR
jgi:hypothetical protein